MAPTQFTEAYRKFKGYMPSIGNLQHPEPRVLRGRNFRWQVSGPYSGWGNSAISKPIPGTRWFATFRFRDRCVACSDTGIYELASPCGDWTLIIDCPTIMPVDANPLDFDYPWTMAYVGSAYYFSHPIKGIIEYEHCNDTWRCLPLDCTPPPLLAFPKQPADNEQANPPQYIPPTLLTAAQLAAATNTPANPQVIAGPIFGITQANNKLIVLARDTVSWSVADQGWNLSCDIHSGAGFQSLSIAEYGRPLAVHETPDGFNVYTTNGLINFKTVCQGSLCQFRVDKISDYAVPINPWAIINHDTRIQYYLSKQGLFVTDGGYPKPWEPIIGQYFAEREIPRLALLNDMQQNTFTGEAAFTQHGIAMFYSPETGEIFISARDHRSLETYGEADDRLADQAISSTDPRATDNPLPLNCYRRAFVFSERYGEWSSFDQPHCYIGPSNFLLDRQHHSMLGFIHANHTLHHFDCSRINAVDCCTFTSLDSYVQLGPFEYQTERNFQQRNEVQHVRIHTGPLFAPERLTMSQTAGRPDAWRDTANVWSWYNARLASSDDGVTIVNNQWDDLWLVNSTFHAQIYSCSNSGLSHMVTLEALEPGQYYELNRIDINGLVTSLI